MPAKDLTDDLSCLLESVLQVCRFRSRPQQGGHGEHPRFPACIAAGFHASKQSWRQQPIDDLLDGLMIDNNVRRPVLVRHPKLLLGVGGLHLRRSPGSLVKRKKPLSHQDFFSISILAHTADGYRRRVPPLARRSVSACAIDSDRKFRDGGSPSQSRAARRSDRLGIGRRDLRRWAAL